MPEHMVVSLFVLAISNLPFMSKKLEKVVSTQLFSFLRIFSVKNQGRQNE